MKSRKSTPQYSSEVCQRAVRMAQEHRGEHPSLWAAVESIAQKIWLRSANLARMGQKARDRCRPARRRHDWWARTPQGPGARGQGIAKGQRDSEAGERVFRPGGARPPAQVLNGFIDRHRDAYGVGPICKALWIAPSGYRRPAARQRDHSPLPAHAHHDAVLSPGI